MNKTITIRKNKTHRVGIRLSFFVMVAISFVVCGPQSPGVPFLLLCILVQFPVFIVFLHYETWNITLTTREIKFRYFFILKKSYRYCEIKDIYIAYSHTLHEHICVVFSDGKQVIFRTNDENATIAKRVLLSHHSIRTLNWK